MRKRALVLVAAAAAATPVVNLGLKAQAQFLYTPVVAEVGDPSDPSNTGSQNGATTSIDAFNDNILNQTTPLASSTWASGTLVNVASSTTEATLTNNPALADAATAGEAYTGTGYVFSSGYAATIGTANVNQNAVNANRVVGFMSVTSNSVSGGTIGATMPNATAYTNDNIRGAVGDDTATNFWTAGTGTGGTVNDGIQYANTNTQVATSANNSRQAQIRQGMLYAGSDTGSFVGISVVLGSTQSSSTPGTPLPTAQGDPGIVNLFETWGVNGSLSTSAGSSPYAFSLLKDPNNPNTPTLTYTLTVGGNPQTDQVSVPFNVAYVDEVGETTGTSPTPGIEKWVYNPANVATNNGWSLAYTIQDPSATTTGFVGLATQLVPNANSTEDSVDLWATTNTTGGNKLEQFVDPLEGTSDTSAESSLKVLATAPSYAAFRGVALAPITTANLTWNNVNAPAGNPSDGATWDADTNVNWNNGNAPTYFNEGDNISFTDNNSGHYAVTLNSSVTPGSITASNSAGNYTVSGTGSIVGGGSVSKSGSGTFTIGTHGTSVGAVSVTGGTLQLGASTGLATATSLAVSANGALDVNNNHLIIQYGSGPDPISSIASLLKTGYNGGNWNGTGGIVSAAAAANHLSYGLGYADSADAGNPASLSSGTIEVKYTLLGDANLDGIVNGVDFGILAANFNKGVTGWDKGDFNYDNVVSGIDFADLAANFNKGASGASIGSPAYDDPAIMAFATANGLLADVPEPASVGLLAITAATLAIRRRRLA